MASVQGAAPRQAGTTDEQRLAEVSSLFERMGLSVSVRDIIGLGLGVRLQVHEGAMYLDPQDAHDLAELLEHAAMEAVHASRSARRG